jgi:uncharacterized protein YdeI (YjbR/CyaY-like superfamily)
MTTPPVAFRRPQDFRAWLARSGPSRTELNVRCFKTAAADRGMTYKQALDEALCFGWIDGVRHALDALSFSVRFTPRRNRSIWSAINIRRMKELLAEGRVAAPGRAAFEARRPEDTRRYSFESKPMALAPAYEKALRARRRAWEHFLAQPPWYRRTSSFWVMSARKEETRQRRLAILIGCSARAEPIPLLDRRKK